MSEPTIEQVDSAVRAVLDRLEGRSVPRNRTFAGRLLALRDVEDWDSGEIGISPGTVVTPLARDHLKKRGVVLRFIGEREVDRRPVEGEWGFAMETRSGMIDAVRRAILDGRGSWSEVGSSTIEAAAWAAARPDRGAAVVTDQGAVACWMANKVEGVRAAWVAESGALERAIRTLGPNLIVIETAGQTIYGIRNLLNGFRRGGAPTTPEALTRGLLARANLHEDRRGDRTGHAVARSSQPAEGAASDHPAHAPGRPRNGRSGPW